jgi:hypothetical protein
MSYVRFTTAVLLQVDGFAAISADLNIALAAATAWWLINDSR